jgi:hypothetical protein
METLSEDRASDGVGSDEMAAMDWHSSDGGDSISNLNHLGIVMIVWHSYDGGDSISNLNFIVMMA